MSNRVRDLQQAALARSDLSADRVLKELSLIAFQRTKQAYRADGTLKAPDEWDDATDATIAGIETEEEVEVVGATDEREPQGHGGALKRARGAKVATRTNKVKRWDKLKALELLCKHFGLLKADEMHPTDKKDLIAGLTDAQKLALFKALTRTRAGQRPGRTTRRG